MDNKERTINRIIDYWKDKKGELLEIQGLEMGLCNICLLDYPNAHKWFNVSLKNM